MLCLLTQITQSMSKHAEGTNDSLQICESLFEDKLLIPAPTVNKTRKGEHYVENPESRRHLTRAALGPAMLTEENGTLTLVFFTLYKYH